jgi:small conductance mechanosensitive channel
MHSLLTTGGADIGDQLGEEISQVVDTVATKGFRYLWAEFVENLQGILPSLVLALSFAVVSLLLTYLITRLVGRWLARSKVEKALHYFIRTVIGYLLVGLIAISTLGILGVPMTPIITALSAVGLALSLAIKDSLSNIAGGVFMLFNCPFKAGDYIEVKGVVGTVREIRLTYTVLETSFNRKIFIPNGDFPKATITNYSAAPIRCMELTFSVAPSPGDIDRAKAIILDVLESSGLLLPDPPVSVRVSGQTDSTVQITCLAWVEPPKLYDLKAYTIQNVRERLSSMNK